MSNRVSVSLDDSAFAAVQRVADFTGMSMSSVVAGLLQPNVAALGELADTLERAKRLREGLKAGAATVFRNACEFAAEAAAPSPAERRDEMPVPAKVEPQESPEQRFLTALQANTPPDGGKSLEERLAASEVRDPFVGMQPWEIEELIQHELAGRTS